MILSQCKRLRIGCFDRNRSRNVPNLYFFGIYVNDYVKNLKEKTDGENAQVFDWIRSAE